ncbi:MAG: sulfotransferase, partial [Pseudomonadota bacterium]|nr:sulfotransferase [Pseudomonadota bacterium]
TAGRTAEARAASAQRERIAALPRELLAVTNHLHEGRLLRAEEICRHYLRVHPQETEGMRLLAQIGIRLGVLDDAEFLLESAVAFAPEDIQLRLDYIDALRRRQKFERSREEAEALYARDPDNPLFQSHLAIESLQTGDYDRAFELFDRVLKALPHDPATLTSRGHALKTMGRQADAVESYRAAFAVKPDHGDAYYALANLKTYRFTDAEMAAMRDQAARPELAFMDRVHIAFALGKGHEDRGEYAESLAHYREGNDLKRAQTRYSADAMTAELARQREACTADLFARHEGDGHRAPDPIFILGLPRAGSTLLEQILASHSQIDGTLELPNILSLAHRLRGRKASASRYPGILHDLTAEQLARFGEQYIADTRIHRQGAPFFIDKMPNNFRHIGLIHLILPNATIIDARRDPMDCCFSGFKQLFAEGQEFTYGLEEIGRYYADYVDLMQHWNEVLPERVLRVNHEDVLDDLEGQTRRMLDHIGLPFEEQCLAFHETKRAVRTASSEQVRQPITRAGQGAWKPYEEWLDPLKAALQS